MRRQLWPLGETRSSMTVCDFNPEWRFYVSLCLCGGYLLVLSVLSYAVVRGGRHKQGKKVDTGSQHSPCISAALQPHCPALLIKCHNSAFASRAIARRFGEYGCEGRQGTSTEKAERLPAIAGVRRSYWLFAASSSCCFTSSSSCCCCCCYRL